MAVELPASKRVASRARRRLAIFAFVLLAFGGLGTAIWLYPTYFLREAVDLWTVSDEVGPADAVAVFGGGIETRPFAAAEYYRKGLVRKVMLANVRISSMTGEILPSETEGNRMVLIKQGVPEEAIELFGSNLSSTFEETMALRAWAVRSDVHTLIIPTEYFSSRRVRWILTREFADTRIHILVPALDDPQYPRREWWKDNAALVNFQNELIKYVYYRIRY
jgi:uncharacterized SAM-binding protein YcdF (DUF218 family)